MELLPQATIKKEQKDARETEVFRKLRVAKSKTEQETELHKLMSDIEPEKRRIKADLDTFRNKAEKRKSDLMGEILALEAKRDRVMEPFYQIKFDAQEMMSAAEQYEKRVKAGAKEVNTKRDAVDAKEKMLSEREEFLIGRETNIATRDAESIAVAERVAIESKQLESDKKAFEIESRLRKNELDKKDSDLSIREVSLETRNVLAEDREGALEKERKHLESQQVTLKLAFDEARKKGIL